MRTQHIGIISLGFTLLVSCGGEGPIAFDDDDVFDRVQSELGASPGRRCGTRNPTAVEVQTADDHVASRKAAATPVEIAVAVHVIASGRTAAAGALSTAAVNRQIDVLNQAYAGGEKSG